MTDEQFLLQAIAADEADPESHPGVNRAWLAGQWHSMRRLIADDYPELREVRDVFIRTWVATYSRRR